LSAGLYLATAALLLLLTHRFVRPLTRGAALVLLLVPLALTGKALFTGGVYGPVDHLYQHDPLRVQASRFGIGAAANPSAIDVASEFFPWRRAVQESLARGEFPVWTAYNLAGEPLAAEMQSAPFSPFTWIACLLPAAQSMTFTAAIVLFLAGAGAFVLARELDRSEGASLAAAVGWAFAASIVNYSQTAMGFATALLPFLMMATHRRSVPLLVAALALITTAGHPESLFLDVLVCAAYGVFEIIRRRERPWPALRVGAIAGVLALLLSAVALLPFLEAVPQSYEFLQKQGAGWAEPKADSEVLATLATNVFPHLYLRGWLSPPIGLIPAETAAVGSVVLALAVFAVWRVRSAQTWFFTALAVAGLAVGTRWPPLIDALRALPLMQITLMERLVFSAGLALVILAAFGVDAIPRRGLRATLLIVLALLGAGMWWVSSNITLAPPSIGHWRVAAELGFLALAVLRPRPYALVALVFAQRAVSEIDTFGTYPASAAYPPVAVLEPLRDVREPFRVVGRGPALPPAMNIFYGLEDPRGYEALTLNALFVTEPLWCGRDATVWFNRVADLTRPFLSFLNVRFALQRTDEDVPAGWRRVGERDGLTLLENERVIERVFVPSRVALTDMSDDDIVQRMQDVTDFRDVAWIASAPPGLQENGPGRIEMRDYRQSGRYRFYAHMERDGYVVISDASWKGWRASVDGVPVEVNRANAAFLAVRVPRGKHLVRLRYRPRSFVIGASVSLITLAGCAFALVIRSRRTRPRRIGG
jgi:hypothetical protein